MSTWSEYIFWYCTKNHCVLKTIAGVLKSKFFCNETGNATYYLSTFWCIALESAWGTPTYRNEDTGVCFLGTEKQYLYFPP